MSTYRKSSPSWNRFLEFLDEHGAKASFIHIHVTKHRSLNRDHMSLNHMRHNMPTGQWINQFRWSGTRQGNRYWAKIYCAWAGTLARERVNFNLNR